MHNWNYSKGMIKNMTESIIKESPSKSMIVDGDAWKERELNTYMSVIDMYGASELFDEDTYEKYGDLRLEDVERDSERKELIFTEIEEIQNSDSEMEDRIFSTEITLNKIQDYREETNSYRYLGWMTGILVVIICVCILIRINIKRVKRRHQYAAEINMEN